MQKPRVFIGYHRLPHGYQTVTMQKTGVFIGYHGYHRKIYKVWDFPILYIFFDGNRGNR